MDVHLAAVSPACRPQQCFKRWEQHPGRVEGRTGSLGVTDFAKFVTMSLDTVVMVAGVALLHRTSLV